MTHPGLFSGLGSLGGVGGPADQSQSFAKDDGPLCKGSSYFFGKYEELPTSGTPMFHKFLASVSRTKVHAFLVEP